MIAYMTLYDFDVINNPFIAVTLTLILLSIVLISLNFVVSIQMNHIKERQMVKINEKISEFNKYLEKKDINKEIINVEQIKNHTILENVSSECRLLRNIIMPLENMKLSLMPYNDIDTNINFSTDFNIENYFINYNEVSDEFIELTNFLPIVVLDIICQYAYMNIWVNKMVIKVQINLIFGNIYDSIKKETHLIIKQKCTTFRFFNKLKDYKNICVVNCGNNENDITVYNLLSLKHENKNDMVMSNVLIFDRVENLKSSIILLEDIKNKSNQCIKIKDTLTLVPEYIFFTISRKTKRQLKNIPFWFLCEYNTFGKSILFPIFVEDKCMFINELKTIIQNYNFLTGLNRSVRYKYF